MPTVTIPDGLTVDKYGSEWWIRHAASRLPVHTVGYRTKAAALAGAARLGELPVDWTGTSADVLAQCEQLPAGTTGVRRAATPPEEIERLRALHVAGTRYLRALEADGQAVTERQSHGLAGTTYTMTCGCVRHFTVEVMGMDAGEPREDLLVRCARHADLVLAPAEVGR